MDTRAERRSLTVHLGNLLEEQEKSKAPAIFVKEIKRVSRVLKAMCRKMTVSHSHTPMNKPLILQDDEEVV